MKPWTPLALDLHLLVIQRHLRQQEWWYSKNCRNSNTEDESTRIKQEHGRILLYLGTTSFSTYVFPRDLFAFVTFICFWTKGHGWERTLWHLNWSLDANGSLDRWEIDGASSWHGQRSFGRCENEVGIQTVWKRTFLRNLPFKWNGMHRMDYWISFTCCKRVSGHPKLSVYSRLDLIFG